MVYNCIDVIQRLVYPDFCRLCGAADARDGLCPGCRGDLPRNRHCCPRCALPLPPDIDATIPCGDCLREPPPFDHSRVPFLYGYPLDRLIGSLKFGHQPGHARVLAALLAQQLESLPLEPPQRLIPVPLHPRRQRRRGFNQATELARHLGRRLGIPVDARSCRRVLATPSQSGLDRDHRRRNLRGAFRLTRPLPYHHLALLDDVVTTGATTAELARLLRRAGVGRIQVWALARTPRIG